MKKILPILFLSVLLITCKDDPEPDPCAGITCLNDGVCINGQCDCPENYEGADCGKQKTPSKIVVTKILITKFPITEPDGGGWDLTDGPDLRPGIYLDNNGNLGTEIWLSNKYFENATSTSSSYEFTPDETVEILPNNKYILYLFDYDETSEDESMGGVIFSPYADDNGFPEELVLNPDGGSTAFKLSFTYQFSN